MASPLGRRHSDQNHDEALLVFPICLRGKRERPQVWTPTSLGRSCCVAPCPVPPLPCMAKLGTRHQSAASPDRAVTVAVVVSFLLSFFFFFSFSLKAREGYYNLFRSAVPFGGQTTQVPSGLSPKRDCTTKKVWPFAICCRAAVPSSGIRGMLRVLCAQ